MIGAEALLRIFEAWGINYFFGCPGTTEVAILDALVNRQRPKFILCTHEAVAVSAADGYARVTGGIGLVTLHANVGLANGISYIHNAHMAKVPLVAINLIKSRSILGRRAFTVAHDHQEMVKQYAKWDWQVLHPKTLVEDLERTLRLAITPPMGPTYLAIPQDILEAEVGRFNIEGPPKGQWYCQPSSRDMSRAADILAKARFPLIISGAGVAQEDVIEQMVKLAKGLSSAVCCEHRLNLDYNPYPTEEDHFVGPFHLEAEFVKHADVILAIGCKLFVEFQPSKKPWIPPGAKLIHLNSDADEIGNLYRVEVGLCSSVKEGMDELFMALSPRLVGRERMLNNRNQRVRSLHEAFLHRRKDYFKATKDCEPLKVGTLVQELAGIVNQNTTLVVDAVTSNDALVEYVPRHNTKSYYASATGASLGWGMGAALGVKIGAPKRQVICVTGDGAFMFGVPALHTADKYHLSVGFIVIDNSCYAAVKAGLLRYKGQAAQKGVFPGTDIGGPDYAAIAKGFGVPGLKVTSKRDLVRLPKVIGKERGPVLVEVVIDPADAGGLGIEIIF